MTEIYLITNLINGKRYVGKTKRGYKFRFEEHCNAHRHGFRTYIGDAIAKYGIENFTVECLECVEDDVWEEREKYYIQKYQSLWTQNGYNITPGGDSNPMDTPEVRQKHLEVCRTPEHRAKVGLAGKGRVMSEETKQKLREANERNADKVYAGFRKYNESRKIRVKALNQLGEVVREFDSIAEACEFVNTLKTNAGCILERCDKYNKNGKRSIMYGYAWSKC